MESPRHHAILALLASMTLVAGCNAAYMMQATAGQWRIARARVPVPQVVADPATPAELRRKLELADRALQFAHRSLSLPDNGSYRDFVLLDRPYVIWNVFAAPEFSLALRTWCFPVAGCVAYRGYFAEQDARAFAGDLAGRGADVHVGGAGGYSTLGFFRDPLLSSATRLGETALVGIIFHELAHQQLYVPGDTVFSESFATLVEQEGVIRWLTARGETAALCDYLRGLERQREVHRLLGATRVRLREIYSRKEPDAARRAAKAAEIERLRAAYRALRARWQEPPYFDGTFSGDINNASLGALAAYDQYVGTLRVMLDGESGDLPAFYRRAAQLAGLRAADRVAVLREITSPTLRGPGPQCRTPPG